MNVKYDFILDTMREQDSTVEFSGGTVALTGGTAAIAFTPSQGEYWINGGTAATLTLNADTTALDAAKSYYFDIKITSTAAGGFALTLPAGWILEDAACGTAAAGRYVVSVHYDAFAELWNANVWKLNSSSEA